MTGIFGAPVSGGSVADFAALMALPSPADGQTAVVVAPVIGTLLTGGIPRTRWVYISGDGWRLAGSQTLLIDQSDVTGVATTDLQALKTYLMPAGLLRALRLFDGYISFAKTGTTNAASLSCWRAGLAGTVGDALLAGTASFAAGNRQYFFSTVIEMPTNTSARYVATGGGGYGAGTGTGQAYPVNVTTPNQETEQIYVTAAIQMAGTTDTPSVSRVIISGV